MSETSRLIVGCGYLGKVLAARWHAQGDVVFATTRSPDRARQFAGQGWNALVADVTEIASLAQLPAVDTAVFCVGYDPASSQSREDVYGQGVRNVLQCLPQSTKRFVLVSTTGVYGDAGGDVVDESTPCDPQRPGGKAFLAAEDSLRTNPDWATKGVVMRLAGIYGPDRVPRAADIREGKPIPAPSSGALNLIHVEDAVQAICRVADQENVSPVYIVSDGCPVERRDYYQEVARLLDAPRPSFVEPPADSPAARRASADRRMTNRRLVEELGFRPKFPSYVEGLAAILGE